MVWRELLDCSSLSICLNANSRLNRSSFISSCSVTSKSSLLLLEATTLTSISAVCRSLVSVDDVFFSFVWFRSTLLSFGGIHFVAMNSSKCVSFSSVQGVFSRGFPVCDGNPKCCQYS